MRAEFIASISQVNAPDWDALWPADYPFTRHAFLEALEVSGSTTRHSGWQPQHLLVVDNERVLAALVLYEKSHSYGEYVFDWGWADAYHRAGLEYYPKLVSAIPFTPATGPRLGLLPGVDASIRNECMECINSALRKSLLQTNGSGFHCLFPDAASRTLFAGGGYLERQGCQFHWFNRNYRDFDDFLAAFTSRKRKAIKRERKKVEEQQVVLQMRPASQVGDSDWRLFAALYQRTYLKRSGHQGYLNHAFFYAIARQMPEQVLLCSAHAESLDNDMLAAALYFRDNTTLYGRYWGAMQEIDGLHFETCYYQGIEYAIQQGLQRFDPGAQGEHKIQRGFTPVKTCSYHWLEHPQFFSAVKAFVAQERSQIQAYCQEGRQYLPFKEGEPLVNDAVLLEDSANPWADSDNVR